MKTVISPKQSRQKLAISLFTAKRETMQMRNCGKNRIEEKQKKIYNLKSMLDERRISSCSTDTHTIIQTPKYNRFSRDHKRMLHVKKDHIAIVTSWFKSHLNCL